MQLNKTTIWDYLRICLPDYWIMVHRYDPKTEAFIRYSAEKNLIRLNERDTTFCKLAVGEHEIWTSNYPYGYGNVSERWNFIDRNNIFSFSSIGRPSRLTIYKLRKLEKKLLEKSPDEQYNEIKKTVDGTVMMYIKRMKQEDV